MFKRLNLQTVVFLLEVISASFTVTLPAAQAPYGFTQAAGPVRATNATLNGMAVPRGDATTAWFEWGADSTYGNSTAPQSIGSGALVVRVSSALPGLTEGGMYHFRLVASNSVGVTRGFDSMFTTGMRAQNWGPFTYGSPIIPPGLTNLSGIASGHRHCLAIRNDGTVAAWRVGSLTPQTVGATNIPLGLSNAVAVAGGFSHCLALLEDGTIVAWGNYADSTPATVPVGISNLIALAGGDYHTVALKSDGTVVAWGKNPVFGGVTNIPAGLSNVVAIACGSSHTLALKADGRVTVWGDLTSDAGSAAAPASATNLVAVATMGWWNLALRADGTVVDWGASYYTDVPKPTNLTNVVQIVSGYGYAEILRTDGTLQGWGGAWDATNIPPSLSNVVAFASGDYHRVGLAPINLPPRCNARSVSGGVNQALPITLTGFDTSGDVLSYRITSLPAKGSLWQYTTNGLGAPITSPGTAVSDPSRVYFVPLTDDYGKPYDSFGVLANDGELDSPPVTNTVSILPAPLIQTATRTNLPQAAFVLSFTGLSNVGYAVWRSTNLLTWSYLGAASQATPGQFSFTDASISNAPTRFYRIISP